MCRRVQCSSCKRPTFAGCGAHIEQVLGGVPRAERCQCRAASAKSTKSDKQSEPRGWFRDLLGR